MSSVNIAGDTSGSIAITAPAVAGSRILTLPAETGTLRSTVSSGTVIQVKHTQFGTSTGALTGTIPIDNTVPTSSEGNAVSALDTTITPKSATNWLIVEISLVYYCTTAATCVVALFQDSGANALAASLHTINTGWTATTTLRHKMVAGTTSATTFKVRVGANTAVGSHSYINCADGTAQVMGGVAVSSITITEVVP